MPLSVECEEIFVRLVIWARIYHGILCGGVVKAVHRRNSTSNGVRLMLGGGM